jgi:hypothetical protein
VRQAADIPVVTGNAVQQGTTLLLWNSGDRGNSGD